MKLRIGRIYTLGLIFFLYPTINDCKSYTNLLTFKWPINVHFLGIVLCKYWFIPPMGNLASNLTILVQILNSNLIHKMIWNTWWEVWTQLPCLAWYLESSCDFKKSKTVWSVLFVELLGVMFCDSICIVELSFLSSFSPIRLVLFITKRYN